MMKRLTTGQWTLRDVQEQFQAVPRWARSATS